jgi:hypothetical protein
MAEPSDSQIHDVSAELAADAVENLKQLMVEGIPQRMRRLRAEAFEVLEAMWLINSTVSNVLIPGGSEKEIRERAFLLASWASSSEALLHNALWAMEPLAKNEAGRELDEFLDATWETQGEERCLAHFTNIYKSQDREEQVSRLNALLEKGEDQ